MRESGSLRDHVVCVRCAAALALDDTPLRCSRCALEYAAVGSIPVVLPRADDHLNLWRQQLNLLKAQGQHTLGAIEEELETPDLSGTGQARLRALGQALRDQLSDITEVIEPALGGPPPSGEAGSLPRGVVEYIQFLYRDWGWEGDGNHENQRALDALRKVMSDRPLGRTLVLGAGACRLAYDLHRECGASETAVLDIDPFLLVFAEAVIRGKTVRLTESTANVQELAQVAKAWSLKAPAGPLEAQQFHFFLANGVAPPFTDGFFDTVVTPWFIDQVADLPALLVAIRRMLAPGGRWLNSGPLLYPLDTTLARRYSREEVFELAEGVGFQIERWSSESRLHLESPLNGRAKLEWVLSFETSLAEALLEPRMQ
jgi:SAM-dependent methyltransferase